MSALIFVALAVAWAAYLIPKALRHHEDVVANRTVEGFSDRLRVLARREPDGRSRSHLVVPGRPADTVESSAAPESRAAPAPAPAPARTAAAVAARRRLRVVLAIVALAVLVVALAASGVVGWAFVAVPAVLLVAWLVACRVMVTKERAVLRSAPARRSAPAAAPEAPAAAGPQSSDLDDLDDPITEEVPAVVGDLVVEPAVVAQPDGSWDPVPVTLPTYVAKAPAPRRSVSTIDLDSTGVWTSGASASDSALAREAEEAERAAKVHAVAEAVRRRASGS